MNSKHNSKILPVVGAAAMILASSVIGFLLVEAVYRIYLYETKPHRFLPVLAKDEHPSLWYFQKSPYQYSEEFGYEYVPGIFNGGYINNGTVMDCYERLCAINERGNSGRIKGSYDDADLKILVFGDSWTSKCTKCSGDQMTWPDFLQDVLEKQLGKSVHVVNFGRDAYGLLQMFDLAAAKVPEWKPDLSVIAFITDDLGRDRLWRTKTILNGHERIMTAVTPNPTPDLHEASDLYLMNSRATAEWCHRLLASQKKDNPIVREFEEVAHEAQQRSSLQADPLSLSHSFVLDLLARGQPFYSTLNAARPAQWPHHEMRDFAEDHRMVANIESLAATGIPSVLVNLAFYPELKKETEYTRIVDLEQDMALLESLRRLTDQPVYETLDHVKWPVEDLESLSRDFPKDHHPSRRGAQFYAEMVAEVLQRHGYAE